MNGEYFHCYTGTMQPSDLHKIANDLRLDVLKMVNCAGGGHVAGPLSSADIIASLFFGGVLNYSAEKPWDVNRDRFVLSCGHYAPVLYAALARVGYFPLERLATFGKMDGLPVHPERGLFPGIEASTGPLGQGMSVAVGIAKALKIQRKMLPRVYCLCSDGELQEGQSWEAIGLSVREKLNNLVWLIDANNVQIEHYVTELGGTAPLVGKLEAWGCHTLQVDGNNIEKVQEVLLRSKNIHDMPVAIIFKTLGGKGVSFLENNPKWHDGKLTAAQLLMAEEELHV